MHLLDADTLEVRSCQACAKRLQRTGVPTRAPKVSGPSPTIASRLILLKRLLVAIVYDSCHEDLGGLLTKENCEHRNRKVISLALACHAHQHWI